MRHHALSRGLSIALAVSVLVFGAGSVVSARTTAHPARLTNVTLQLKWLNQAQFMGYYVAINKGFYAQQGLHVTLRQGGPTIAPEQVVASGGADFGVDWLSALIKSREQGLPLQNIAQIYQASGMRLITFKSTGITSISQFKGHKVGVWFFGNEYQFFALMAKYHMSPPANYMSVVSQPFTMDLFLNHTLDVAHAMTYNELGIVLDRVPKSSLRIFDYNKLGVSILEDGLFAKPSWLKSHAAIAAKFLKASIEGWQWAVKNPDQAGRISFTYAGANAPGGLHHQIYMAREVAKLINYGAGLKHTIGYMDPASYHRTWSTLLREKVINHPPVDAYTQKYWQMAGGH
ncbi:MAG TPA: ABC transporter substrate-binding protein [Chloroflexota bacterium]|nr:ABC transporter substrate-binding protein [Chloroflexota bacterium]